MLPANLQRMKDDVKAIITRINAGEPTVTSVVHLSEVANILEARIPRFQARSMLEMLVLKDSLN